MLKKYDDFVCDFSDDEGDFPELPEEEDNDWVDEGLWPNEDVSPKTSKPSSSTDTQPLGDVTNQSTPAPGPSKKSSKKTTTTTYICPECSKSYKSASGFKGHAKKVHGQDLKASQHKNAVSVGDEPDTNQTVSKDHSRNVPANEKVASNNTSTGFVKHKSLYNIEQLKRDMPSSVIQAFKDITTDKRFNFEGSVHGEDVCKLSKLLITCLQKDPDISSTPITDLLVNVIWKVLQSGDQMKTFSGHNEEVWHTFYNEWIDTTTTQQLAKQFHTLLNDKTTNDFHVFILTRVFLYRLLVVIRASCDKVPVTQEEAQVAIQMSEEEKQALRYFAGYVPFKILKKLKRSKRNMAGYIAIIESMKEDQSNYTGGSMAATKGWLHQQDRGGLFNLTDTAFLFFKEVECICKRHLVSGAFDSSSKDINGVIQNDAFTNRYVNVLWSSVARDVASEEASLALASMIIKLYVQIRCFSYAKSVVELVKKKKNIHTKGSKGLRKSLV